MSRTIESFPLACEPLPNETEIRRVAAGDTDRCFIGRNHYPNREALIQGCRGLLWPEKAAIRREWDEAFKKSG